MTGTTLQNCFENDLILRLHQQIVFFASSVVNEMSSEEFSIFEPSENHRNYVPHSRFEKLKVFCKKSWASILIILVLSITLITVSLKHDAKLKSLNQENRGNVAESHDAVIDELRSEIMTLNQKMKQLNPEEKESQRSNELEFYASAASARNCKELFNHGFKTSGEYRIDPDKRYQGQSSFMAYCDFANNLTRISPQEKLIQFSGFTLVDYSPTTDQMVGLITHSGSCYQTIELECTNAPISARNLWWIDRYGKILFPLANNIASTASNSKIDNNIKLFLLVFRQETILF